MTKEEAIEIFEKASSLHEQLEIECDIRDIDCILSQCPVAVSQVKAKVKAINDNHPDNIIIFNLIFPPQGDRVSVDNAPDQALISDLKWKRTYLQAKKAGKVFDELRKEMQKNEKGRGNGQAENGNS